MSAVLSATTDSNHSPHAVMISSVGESALRDWIGDLAPQLRETPYPPNAAGGGAARFL